MLGLLIYSGVLPLALAGAAALAMRVASQAVSATVAETDQLFEAGYYVELHRSCLHEARTRRRAAPTATVPGDPDVIELSGVSFSYPGATEPAIDQVSVVLRRGEVVALVGENGSGKSTLAKLITGLYLPERGRVQWDGVDTAIVDPDDLLGRVAVVLESRVHWPMTAENNVRIGRLERPDPDAEDRDAAARDSGADMVVSELPDGWTTVLSREFQSGRDLSDGQWQRLSVARGPLPSPPAGDRRRTDSSPGRPCRARRVRHAARSVRSRRGTGNRARHPPARQRPLRRPNPGTRAWPAHRAGSPRRTDGTARHLLRAVHPSGPRVRR